MNRNILRLEPRNLPVYVYRFDVNIALVHDQRAFKLKGYTFPYMKVASNQPLRPGDILANNCCYYGNENTEIIPDLRNKKLLRGAEKELRSYYGCLINRVAISYVDDASLGKNCGYGEGTVFIGLNEIHNLDYWKKRIPNWNERLECIGEVPKQLMC